MKTATMRRLGIALFGGGLLLLLISFLPLPTGQTEILETPETAEEPTAAATVEMSPEQLADEGAALFQAKGCPACHRHDAIENTAISPQIGPNLTYYDPDPDFVREWLRDPPAIRPDTQMPDLNLSEAEIEALVAFLEK